MTANPPEGGGGEQRIGSTREISVAEEKESVEWAVTGGGQLGTHL